VVRKHRSKVCREGKPREKVCQDDARGSCASREPSSGKGPGKWRGLHGRQGLASWLSRASITPHITQRERKHTS